MKGKVLFVFFFIPLLLLCSSKTPVEDIKRSAIAGRWYSSEGKVLAEQIDNLLKKALSGNGCDNPLMLIVPHAGYQYSGGIAASGYRMIGSTGSSRINPDIIVILGPSHYEHFRGCSTINADFVETPLGKVRINREVANELQTDSLFEENRPAFQLEHSIEIHLPFLQRIFGEKMAGDISILPLLTGDVTDDEAKHIASKLISVLNGRRALIIVSTDFTHYGPNYGYLPFRYSGSSTAGRLKELDYGAINFILRKDLSGFSKYTDKTGITICGRDPIKIALSIPVKDLNVKQISYDTSGNITGDYNNSVSYTSIILCGKLPAVEKSSAVSEPVSLSGSDKEFLLRIARENIISWLKNGKGITAPENIPPNCSLKRGSFVTLKSGGDLRGCIGYIGYDRELIRTVIDNSYNAAFGDPRFSPLRIDELKDLKIEISVLTEPSVVKSVDEIMTGRDGLIIQNGMFRGLLLPQVAVEQGWNRDMFLRMTCVKAGLPEDSWKESSTRIFRFQATVFGEEKK